MKTHTKHRTILLLFCLLFSKGIHAQYNLYGSSSSQKNAFTFNLWQYAVNEINLGYERFFSERKSIELNGGLIYRNDFMIKQAESWSNSQYFYERGFAARLAYKIYRKAADNSKRKNYMAFGLNYQYLYLNNEWFETEKDVKVENSSTGETLTVNEEIYMHRFRNRIGVQFTLGKIFPLGNTFAIEIYYGVGLRGILSNRYDVAHGATINNQKYVLEYLNFEDQKFYFRPTIHAGVKFRIGW